MVIAVGTIAIFKIISRGIPPVYKPVEYTTSGRVIDEKTFKEILKYRPPTSGEIESLKRHGREQVVTYIKSAVVTRQIKDPQDMEELTAALESDDWDLLREAIRALSRLGPDAIEPLAVIATDGEHFYRYEAKLALGNIKDPRAVEPLLQASLNEKAWPTRGGSASALAGIGDPAVEPLIAALNHQQSRIRETAAEALGAIGDQRSIEPLAKKFNDPEVKVRVAAAEALSRIGGPAQKILIDALKYDRGGLQAAIVKSLAKTKDPEILPLISALLSKEGYKNTGIRKAAIAALASMGEVALEPLIAATKNKDWWVRKSAAIALGGINDPRVVEPLAWLIDDDVQTVRKSALYALERIKSDLKVEPLIKALKYHSDSTIRTKAARILGETGDSRAVDPLLAATRWFEKDDLRITAIRALGQTGSEKAVESLIKILLNDRDTEARRYAAESLGAIKRKKANP